MTMLGLATASAQQQDPSKPKETPVDTVIARPEINQETPPKAEVSPAAEEDKNSFPLDNFYAEIKKRPRSLFSKLIFGLSTGYGSTFFSHELTGYGVYQEPGLGPSIFPDGVTTTRYSNWVNERVLTTTPVSPGALVVPAGTDKLGFSGNGTNIPLKLTVHVEIKKKYRLGAGYSYEYMSMGNMAPTTMADQINNMSPSNPSGFMSKYFGILGVSFYRMGNYLFTGDLQIGGFSPGSNFDSAIITTGVYINGGVTIERELSEYLRLFVRPSYEFKSYSLTLPEGGSPIDHSMNAFYLNVGVTYRIPDLPKCYNSECRIQMNHAHGDREYRSRVHPVYKKQNPNYGENHPNLIKYKGKNKKKLSPY